MNTSDIGGMAVHAASGFRTRGCVITEYRVAAPAPEPDADRIARQARQMAEEMVRREVLAMKEAERKRIAQWETEWQKSLDKLRGEIQRQVIDMAIGIAEVILQHELPDAAMLRGMIEETLAPVSDLQGMRIRLSPRDIEAARQGQLSPARGAAIEWIADPNLKPGDMIIESRNGVIDGRLHERLGALTEALKDPTRHGGGNRTPAATS